MLLYSESFCLQSAILVQHVSITVFPGIQPQSKLFYNFSLIAKLEKEEASSSVGPGISRKFKKNPLPLLNLTEGNENQKDCTIIMSLPCTQLTC